MYKNEYKQSKGGSSSSNKVRDVNSTSVFAKIVRTIGYVLLVIGFILFTYNLIKGLVTLPNGSDVDFLKKFTNIEFLNNKYLQLSSFFLLAVGFLLLGLVFAKSVVGKVFYVIFWLLGLGSAFLIAFSSTPAHPSLYYVLPKSSVLAVAEIIKLDGVARLADLVNKLDFVNQVHNLVLIVGILIFLVFNDALIGSKKNKVFGKFLLKFGLSLLITVAFLGFSIPYLSSIEFFKAEGIGKTILSWTEYGLSAVAVLGSLFAAIGSFIGIVSFAKN